MPIKPENRDRYPKDWRAIRKDIVGRAHGLCECKGECGDAHDRGRCYAPNGSWIRRSVAQSALFKEVAIDSIIHWEDSPTLAEWRMPIKVVLTIAHLDHSPENNDPSNLRALCQRCHLRYDADHHATTRGETRLKRQPVLPFEELS